MLTGRRLSAILHDDMTLCIHADISLLSLTAFGGTIVDLTLGNIYRKTGAKSSSARGEAVAEIERFLSEDDLKKRSEPTSKVDLAEQLHLIQEVVSSGSPGVVIRLSPDEDEHQRMTKRRLTDAAKQLGYTLTWRSAPAGRLRFVLSQGNETPPGVTKRGPRKKKEPQEDTQQPAVPGGV